MAPLKLLESHHPSVSDQMLVIFRGQCLLHLLEGVNILAEDDEVAELVV